MINGYLSEVARVVFVEENSVMMLSTSITSTSWMRSMLSNTTMTCTNMSSLLSVVMQSGRLTESKIVYRNEKC